MVRRIGIYTNNNSHYMFTRQEGDVIENGFVHLFKNGIMLLSLKNTEGNIACIRANRIDSFVIKEFDNEAQKDFDDEKNIFDLF